MRQIDIQLPNKQGAFANAVKELTNARLQIQSAMVVCASREFALATFVVDPSPADAATLNRFAAALNNVGAKELKQTRSTQFQIEHSSQSIGDLADSLQHAGANI